MGRCADNSELESSARRRLEIRLHLHSGTEASALYRQLSNKKHWRSANVGFIGAMILGDADRAVMASDLQDWVEIEDVSVSLRDGKRTNFY